MKFIFFHQPAIRRYNYKPLYFVPEKEEHEKRKRKVLGKDFVDNENDQANHASRIRGTMKQKHISFADLARKEQRKSNLRLLAIIAVLSIIAYYLYSSSAEWLMLF